MVKVIVDKEKCIGCGSCAAICRTFEMRDGKAHVKKMPEKITCEKEAESICPVSAISVK